MTETTPLTSQMLTKSQCRRCHKCQRVFLRVGTHLDASAACRDSDLLTPLAKASIHRLLCARTCQQLQTADCLLLSHPLTPPDPTQYIPTFPSQPTYLYFRPASLNQVSHQMIQPIVVLTLGDDSLCTYTCSLRGLVRRDK